MNSDSILPSNAFCRQITNINGNNKTLSYDYYLITGQTLSRYYHPAYGYDYVGWIVGDEEEIEMIFRFDAYRNFSRIRLFSYVNDELEAR